MQISPSIIKMLLFIALLSLLSPVLALANLVTPSNSITHPFQFGAIKHITVIETYDYFMNDDEMVPQNYSTFHKPNDFSNFGYYDYVRYHATECLQAQNYPVISDKARPIAEEYYTEVIHVAIPRFPPKNEFYKEQYWRNVITLTFSIVTFFIGFYGVYTSKTQLSLANSFNYIGNVTTMLQNSFSYLIITSKSIISTFKELISMNSSKVYNQYALLEGMCWISSVQSLRPLQTSAFETVIARLFQGIVSLSAVKAGIFSNPTVYTANTVPGSIVFSELASSSRAPEIDTTNDLTDPERMSQGLDISHSILEPIRSVFPDLTFDLEAGLVGMPDLSINSTSYNILQNLESDCSINDSLHNSSQSLNSSLALVNFSVNGPTRSILSELDLDTDDNLASLPASTANTIVDINSESKPATPDVKDDTEINIEHIIENYYLESKSNEAKTPSIDYELTFDTEHSVAQESEEEESSAATNTPISMDNSAADSAADSGNAVNAATATEPRKLPGRWSASVNLVRSPLNSETDKKPSVTESIEGGLSDRAPVHQYSKEIIEMPRTDGWFHPRRSEFPEYDLIIYWAQQFGYYDLSDAGLIDLLAHCANDTERNFKSVRQTLVLAYYFALRMEFLLKKDRSLGVEYLKRSLYNDIHAMEMFSILVNILDAAGTAQMIFDITFECSNSGKDWLKHIETIYTLYKSYCVIQQADC